MYHRLHGLLHPSHQPAQECTGVIDFAQLPGCKCCTFVFYGLAVCLYVVTCGPREQVSVISSTCSCSVYVTPTSGVCVGYSCQFWRCIITQHSWFSRSGIQGLEFTVKPPTKDTLGAIFIQLFVSFVERLFFSGTLKSILCWEVCYGQMYWHPWTANHCDTERLDYTCKPAIIS